MHEKIQALLDRHETNPPVEHSPQVYVPDMSHLSAEIRRLSHVVEQNITQVALTDREVPESLLSNFPCPGYSRFIVRRTGEGGDYTLNASSTLLILESNEARIGGQIVNIGAGAVKLFLSVDLQGATGNFLTAAIPVIGLNANGGAWDLTINKIPWCGNVVAVTGATASEVTVAAF